MTKNIPISLNKALAEKCKRSFYYFVKYFWDTIIAEDPVWNWHIEYLCGVLQRIGEGVAKRQEKEFDYTIINVPPGSSKSTIVSEMYPIWCWTIDATQRFICGSYAATPAEDLAEKCYNIYISEKFRNLFPELRTKNAVGGKTHFKNGLRGERYTTSTGSGITGIHAHQLIVDDPMNPQIAASKVERERANKWLSETLSSRKVSHKVTAIIIVMQRLHEMDTTGYLLKKTGLKIKHICIPAEMSNDVKPVYLRDFYINGLFDPERKSKEILISQKAELGSYGYSGQMQQRPSPDEGGIIKKEWFNISTRTTFKATSSPIHFQLDTAYTDDTSNDPSAIIAYYKEGENIFIVNVQSVWKEFPVFIIWVKNFVFSNGYSDRSMIRVEPKASGKSIVQQIKAGTSLNIKEDDPPKYDKITRLYEASPKIEAGRIFLHQATWNESFIDQVTSFPNAQHDDEVDCLTAIVRNELLIDPGMDISHLAAMLP